MQNWFKNGGDLSDDEDAYNTSKGTSDKRLSSSQIWLGLNQSYVGL